MFRDFKWSKTEKEIARKAFESAYHKECGVITARLRNMIARASEPSDIWRIHDYLSKQRRETDQKYDYRYSVLPMVFARLIREGWMTENDLRGLGEEKLGVIKSFLSL